MCGFAGFVDSSSVHFNHEGILDSMGAAIKSRGPDSSGVWFDASSGVGLSHRRLSILDLSSAGHQPMLSGSERYVIAFNGEIYNHIQLRQDLVESGCLHSWRGHSDTETLLAGFDFWGVEDTLRRAVGMFAFALWDIESGILTLGRDRIGEKPLYYGNHSGVFLFGSELKALKAHPSFIASIDRDSLVLFLRHNYIPAPYSIYENISKLEPGCLLRFSSIDAEPSISRYWSPSEVAQAGLRDPFSGSAVNAVDELDALLKKSIKQQMLSDVPLGAFLSGGIDSSTVAAVMQDLSSSPVKTFSIGFSVDGYDEAAHAKLVANHLGTDHTEMYVSAEDALAVIPKLGSLYCEPFADSSQIPTYIVSKLAKRDVTVSLSGDGGDELFCGYNRYQLTSRLWNKISKSPSIVRQLVSNGVLSVSPELLNSLGSVLPFGKKFTNLGDKLHKGASVLNSNSAHDLYLGLVSHHNDPESLVINGHEPSTELNHIGREISGLSDVEQMMLLDLMTYLPDDILVKVDRAAMGVSLETRVPFLDHRIVEFAWKLPLSIKLREGVPKWPLRQVLYRYVPRELIDRPKMGFGVPLDSWLRGPLRDWAESLLAEDRLLREGYFRPEPIKKVWDEHLSGKRNRAYLLWNILMFQAWLEEN